MELFKKKNSKQSTENKEINRETNSNESGFEILDLDKEEKNNISPENKKENRIIFGIILALLLLVLLLPTLTGLLDKKSIFSYTKEVGNIETNKTVDGMIEIGKDEGSITVKKIQFYNVSKKSNNNINIVYLPQSSIKNVNDYNIFIELYNKNKNVIYRTKFIHNQKLERKVQGIYTMNVNSTIYAEATYAKVLIIDEKEFNKTTDTLECNKTITNDGYKINSKVIYNFSDFGLINYKVDKTKELISNDTENNEENNNNINTNVFKDEAEEISKTNISDLVYDEEKLSYSVDVKTFEQRKSEYKLLHSLGSVKRQIILTQQSNNWSCK